MRAMLVVTALMMPSCVSSEPAPVPKDPAKEELEELNGSWKLISEKIHGVEVLDQVKMERFITFKNGEFTWSHDGAPAGKIVTIDPSQTPKEVDYTYKEGVDKGKTHKAIYKLYVDTFVDCFGPAGSARPTEFQSTRYNNLTVMVCKRVKEKD